MYLKNDLKILLFRGIVPILAFNYCNKQNLM